MKIKNLLIGLLVAAPLAVSAAPKLYVDEYAKGLVVTQACIKASASAGDYDLAERYDTAFQSQVEWGVEAYGANKLLNALDEKRPMAYETSHKFCVSNAYILDVK